jgi:peptidoglycan/LPS O-acetylase OafA/YrhL
MTKGNLHTLTLDHWKTALYTGAIAGLLALLFAIERWLHLQQNRWFFAVVAFLGTFIGDFLAHPSHFGGPWGEPMATAVGGAVLSLILSSTAFGNYLVRVAEAPKL